MREMASRGVRSQVRKALKALVGAPTLPQNWGAKWVSTKPGHGRQVTPEKREYKEARESHVLSSHGGCFHKNCLRGAERNRGSVWSSCLIAQRHKDLKLEGRPHSPSGGHAVTTSMLLNPLPQLL